MSAVLSFLIIPRHLVHQITSFIFWNKCKGHRHVRAELDLSCVNMMKYRVLMELFLLTLLRLLSFQSPFVFITNKPS